MREGHGEPCHHCGRPCDALAANPLLWPTMLPAEQSVRPYHMGCAADLLRDAARYRWIVGNGVGRLDDLYDTCNWKPAPGQIDALVDAEIAREKAESGNG